MAESFKPEHVALHRAWLFCAIQGKLTENDFEHILSCRECARVFRICLKSTTFADALKQIEEGGIGDDIYPSA